MELGSELLKSLLDESDQRVLEKNKLSEEYYKKLNKHTECSKCHDKITQDNYKKDRSICRKCYSKYMLDYNSSRRGDYNKLDNSNNFDSSGKQVRSRKENSSNKQDKSRKQDTSINLKNIDPDCLMEKFSELYKNKYDSVEKEQAAREHAEEILNELLRVKAITKRPYNTLYKKCEKSN